jgi:hypothetical protein
LQPSSFYRRSELFCFSLYVLILLNFGQDQDARR